MHGESFGDEEAKFLEKPFMGGGCGIRAPVESIGFCGSPVFCGLLDDSRWTPV